MDEHLQQLENSLAKAQSSAEKLAVYHDIVYHCQTADHAVAMYYYKKMMRLAKSEGDVPAQVHALRQYVSNLILNGELDKAERLCLRAVALLDSINDQRYNAAIQRTLGIICDERGDYAKALRHYYVALRLAEEANDVQAALPVYLNLSGFFHNRLADHRKSIRYCYRAYKLARSLRNYRVHSVSCIQLAEFYFSLGDIAKGKKYLDEGLKVANRHKFHHALLFTRSALAHYYTLQRDYVKAEVLFREALIEAQEQGNYVSAFTDIPKLADCYIHLKQWKKAEQVLQQFESLQREHDSAGDVEGILRQSAELAKHKKQLSRAIKHLEKLLELKKEVYKSDWQQTMDILEQSYKIENYRKEKEDAEQLAQERMEFIQTMSREIAPSLYDILRCTNALIEQNSDSDNTEHLHTMQSSALHLQKLMQDILDMSTIDAGRVVIEKAVMNISHILNDVQKTFYMEAAEKKLSFRTTIHPDVPVLVIGDAARLTQVLINLCSNALKFTSKGSVGVSVCCEGRRRSDKLKLRFTVVDSGIGISNDQMTRLFQRFEQGGASVYRQFGGTGLGLSITKQLVELMGGKIHVESLLGKGSIFSVSLPVGVVW